MAAPADSSSASVSHVDSDHAASSAAAPAPAAGERLTVLQLCTRYTPLPLDASVKAACPRCTKKHTLFCPDCALPVTGVTLPRVRLPLHVDIIRDPREPVSKSSSPYLQVLSPDFTRLFILPALPPLTAEYRPLFLFPSPSSTTVRALPDLSRFTHLVVLDCAWQKVASCMRDDWFTSPHLTHVHIAEYATLFWRYNDLGAACVSTNEAVYLFMRELQVEAARRAAAASPHDFNASTSTSSVAHPSDPACRLYDGRLDDLLSIFLSKARVVLSHYTSSSSSSSASARLHANYAHLREDAAADSRERALAGRKRIRGSSAVRMDVVSSPAAALLMRSRKLPRGVGDAEGAADGAVAAEVGEEDASGRAQLPAAPPSC